MLNAADNRGVGEACEAVGAEGFLLGAQGVFNRVETTTCLLYVFHVKILFLGLLAIGATNFATLALVDAIKKDVEDLSAGGGAAAVAVAMSAEATMLEGRGLHSFSFQLNVSAFCGIGGAFRGYLWGVYEVSGGVRGCLGCVLVS